MFYSQSLPTQLVRRESLTISSSNWFIIADPYVVPQGAAMRTMEKEGFRKAGHEVNFKPQHSTKQKVKAAYEWDAKFAQPVHKKEIIKEMTDVKFGEAAMLNFEKEELDDLLKIVCAY